MTMLVKLHHAFHPRKRPEKNDFLQFNKLEKLTPLCTQPLTIDSAGGCLHKAVKSKKKFHSTTVKAGTEHYNDTKDIA